MEDKYKKCNGCNCHKAETCDRARKCGCTLNEICEICFKAGDPRKKSAAHKHLEKFLSFNWKKDE